VTRGSPSVDYKQSIPLGGDAMLPGRLVRRFRTDFLPSSLWVVCLNGLMWCCPLFAGPGRIVFATGRSSV
jgi:hypothetical protein